MYIKNCKYVYHNVLRFLKHTQLNYIAPNNDNGVDLLHWLLKF